MTEKKSNSSNFIFFPFLSHLQEIRSFSKNISTKISTIAYSIERFVGQLR